MSVDAIRQLMNRGTSVSVKQAVRSVGLPQMDDGLRSVSTFKSPLAGDLGSPAPLTATGDAFAAVLAQALDPSQAAGSAGFPDGWQSDSLARSSSDMSVHAAYLQALAGLQPSAPDLVTSAPDPVPEGAGPGPDGVDSPLFRESTPILPETPIDQFPGLWEVQQAIELTPSARLVEQPGLLAVTGNGEADELVGRVLSLRLGRGLTADASDRDVSSAQAILASLGYDIGSYGPYANGVDGILGPKTSEALRRFQAGQGLAETGTLTAETSARLLLQGKPALDRITADWERVLTESPFSATAYAGTANPYWYVRFVAQAGDDPDTMGNIDAVFKGRLAALARDSGQQADFGEGFRTLERQAWFYQRYLDGTGALAAKPGQSRHNMGLAVDTQSGWLQRIDDGKPISAQVTLQRYGLCKPMADGQGRGREPWHIEPIETRSNG